MEHRPRGDLADPPTCLDAQDVHPARLLAVEPDPDERPWVVIVVSE